MTQVGRPADFRHSKHELTSRSRSASGDWLVVGVGGGSAAFDEGAGLLVSRLSHVSRCAWMVREGQGLLVHWGLW